MLLRRAPLTITSPLRTSLSLSFFLSLFHSASAVREHILKPALVRTPLESLRTAEERETMIAMRTILDHAVADELAAELTADCDPCATVVLDVGEALPVYTFDAAAYPRSWQVLPMLHAAMSSQNKREANTVQTVRGRIENASRLGIAAAEEAALIAMLDASSGSSGPSASDATWTSGSHPVAPVDGSETATLADHFFSQEDLLCAGVDFAMLGGNFTPSPDAPNDVLPPVVDARPFIAHVCEKVGCDNELVTRVVLNANHMRLFHHWKGEVATASLWERARDDAAADFPNSTLVSWLANRSIQLLVTSGRIEALVTVGRADRNLRARVAALTAAVSGPDTLDVHAGGGAGATITEITNQAQSQLSNGADPSSRTSNANVAAVQAPSGSRAAARAASRAAADARMRHGAAADAERLAALLCKTVVLGDPSQCEALIAIVSTLRWSERRRVAEPLEEDGSVTHRYSSYGVATSGGAGSRSGSGSDVASKKGGKKSSSKSGSSSRRTSSSKMISQELTLRRNRMVGAPSSSAEAALLARRGVASSYAAATVDFITALRKLVLCSGARRTSIPLPPHAVPSEAHDDLSLFELLVGAALLSTIVALRAGVPGFETVAAAPACAVPGFRELKFALPPPICAAAASLLLSSRVGDGDDVAHLASVRRRAGDGSGSGSSKNASGGRSGEPSDSSASAVPMLDASGKVLTLTSMLYEWLSAAPFPSTAAISVLPPLVVAKVAAYSVLMGRDIAELRSRAVVSDAFRAKSGQFWIGSLVELHSLKKSEMNGAIGAIVVGCEQINAAQEEARAVAAAAAEAQRVAAEEAERAVFEFVEVDFTKTGTASGAAAAAAMIGSSSTDDRTPVVPPAPPAEPVRAVVRFAVPGTNQVKTCSVKSINLKEAILSKRLRSAYQPSMLSSVRGRRLPGRGRGDDPDSAEAKQSRDARGMAKARGVRGPAAATVCLRTRPIAIAAHFMANSSAAIGFGAAQSPDYTLMEGKPTFAQAQRLGTWAHLYACDRCKCLVGCGGEKAATALAHAAADSFTLCESLQVAVRDIEQGAWCVASGAACALNKRHRCSLSLLPPTALSSFLFSAATSWSECEEKLSKHVEKGRVAKAKETKRSAKKAKKKNKKKKK